MLLEIPRHMQEMTPLSEKEPIKDVSETNSEHSFSEVECDGCSPIKQYQLPTNATFLQKVAYAVAWPPHGKMAKLLTWGMLVAVGWAALYSIVGDDALPGGNLFSIVFLLVLAQLGGSLVSKIFLPPLLGMLLVGIAVRSIPGLDIIGTNIDSKWSAVLRKMALVVILTRAGLGLDPKALRQLSFMVIRLGILPNLVEMSVVSVVTHFLMGFPWLWSILLGFILSGVSPSVVVPCMLSLSDQGLGLDKGIPTLIIAGLSVDNVLSITGFGVLLGVIFSDGSIMWQAFKGPIEIMMGLCFGLIIGSLCWVLPNRQSKSVASFRWSMLLGCNLLAIFGSVKIGFGGAGPLAALATAFVAGVGWRRQGWTDAKNPVRQHLNLVWQFFLPLLFGLIGTEIDLSALEGNTVMYGLITLLAGVSFRIVASYFSVLGGELNLKERIFVALAWLPKATVQAAVGSTAYDMAQTIDGNPDYISPEEHLGKQVLTIAVLVILIAAPIGAAAIMLSAPKLLKRKLPQDSKDICDV